MITPYDASRIILSGTSLPILDADEYSDIRLRDIAIKQAKLKQELFLLEQQVINIYLQENKIV